MTITAKVIADSISPDGIRITTMQLRYPKFIHGEFMTHRVFSRNASSSRAIPVERLIQDVMDDPATPIHWGKNQKGMQADTENNTVVITDGGPMESRTAWLRARDKAVEAARAFTNAGYHKQIVNRLLEPFCHINVVVTATEWNNFFTLRRHPDAQPEMRVLAETILAEMKGTEPLELKYEEWHLPYIDKEDTGDLLENAIKVSVARCARVSYVTQDGKKSSIEDDLILYERLVGAQPLHASPAEHQATPNNLQEDLINGNFKGWIQHRKLLSGENSNVRWL